MSAAPDPLARRLQSRPAWRVAVLAAGTVFAALLAIVILVTVAEVTAPYSPLPARLHQAVVGLPVVLGLYEAGRRLVLRAPAEWFYCGRPTRRVGPWIVVGLGLPAVIFGAELGVLGATHVAGPPALSRVLAYAAASVAAGLLAGVLEELALRGVLLRLLDARWGPRAAVGVSAAVFASLHQGHATGGLQLVLVLSSMFAAGLLLGIVVVRTRSVWPAVALHTGWNTVFGGQLVAVAGPGSELSAAVLGFHHTESSVWLTGGAATLGAAPATTAALLLAAVIVARVVEPPGRPAP